jgi:hypothetical protein
MVADALVALGRLDEATAVRAPWLSYRRIRPERHLATVLPQNSNRLTHDDNGKWIDVTPVAVSRKLEFP